MFILLCITIYMLICSIKHRNIGLIIGSTTAILYFALSIVNDVPALLKYAFPFSAVENIVLFIFVILMSKMIMSDKGEKDG